MNEHISKIEQIVSNQKDLKQLLKDISSQKILFEALLHIVNDGILVINDPGEIIFINQTATKYLFKKDDPKPIQDSFLSDIIKNTKNLDFLSYVREIEVIDPELKYFNITCLPFELKSINPLRIIIIKDITQFKLSSMSNITAPNFSDNLTFGAGIAHELGNPIASLSIHAQLLKKLFKLGRFNDQDKSQILESIDILNSELLRLDQTIHDFLDAVRPTNPRFTINNLHQIINDTIKTLEQSAKENKVKIEFNECEDHEIFLFDQDRIKQALTNVILNALEVSKTESKIVIETHFIDDLCQILIIDHGKGIKPEEISNIFDPYYTTKQSGNGLGLVITYRIIKDHGGTISVKSKPGMGTTFTLTIPIRRKAIQQIQKH